MSTYYTISSYVQDTGNTNVVIDIKGAGNKPIDRATPLDVWQSITPNITGLRISAGKLRQGVLSPRKMHLAAAGPQTRCYGISVLSRKGGLLRS